MSKDVRDRGFIAPIKIDEAWKQFSQQANIQVLGWEKIPIRACPGRVLAENIIANINVPHFNRSAMDGYAVRAKDTFGASTTNPIILNLVGNINLGQPYKLKLGEKETVKVSTGAAMPENADSVVMLEYTEPVKANKIAVYTPVTPGLNVSKIGEDIKLGEKVLAEGTILKPQDIALLAALGVGEVKVRHKPKVAVFSTGNELVDLDGKLGENQIYDSNRYFLLSAVEDYGGLAIDLGIAKDDVTAIRATISEAVKLADLILVSGGTSVGLKDHAPQALNTLENSRVIVHGVSMKPGKPVALGVAEGKPIVFLPGNPAAAMIAFHVFAKKILNTLIGAQAPRFDGTIIKAKLLRRIPSTPGTRDFVRATLTKVGNEIAAEPIRVSGASLISPMVKADGLIIVPEEKEGVEKGEIVDVILL